MISALLLQRDGKIELSSPCVGQWREAPAVGSLVAPGMRVGRMEVLGVLHEIVAPAGAHGVVIDVGGNRARARRPVSHGSTLLVLDPDVRAQQQAQEAASQSGGELMFCAPSSGRFFARPGPGKLPFVSPGDEVLQGQTVAILEVMKTFNRVQYGGAGLPDPARVIRVIPADGQDLENGDPILEVEPA